jgi:hypothetical protein
MRETRNVYTILVGNLLIKVYVENREIDGWITLGCISLTEVLAQDLVRWREIASTMNIRLLLLELII